VRLSTLLLVGGILALVFGLNFLLAPAALLPLYALQPDPGTALMGRFFGAALVQLGATLYLVRDVREPATRRGLVLAGVAGSLAGLTVALLGQLSGLVNAMGWSTVAIYGALLLGYASQLGDSPERP
jgi:hypothetical protein